MNFCGWLKVFKRKGKQTAGEGGSNEVDDDGELRPEGEKRANNGRSTGGWKRKIKSVTKQSGTGRTQSQQVEQETTKEKSDTKMDENSRPAVDTGAEDEATQNVKSRNHIMCLDNGYSQQRDGCMVVGDLPMKSTKASASVITMVEET
ncbi:uncharacterized protein LOC101258754 [Anopheles sinensis]|uniref:Uncharacterized protein LOC101258754 n=1 Tax=Anopheles sinensis TaxID=74873 RepID=A0A084VR23_ANOSI|nr:uncharacterized protein LOC101258754 [Anopheles sinensis]